MVSVPIKDRFSIGKANIPRTDLNQMYSIYFNWAIHFGNKYPEKMEAYLSDCLTINPFVPEVLRLRSVFKRKRARTASALEDALRASDIDPNNPNISLEVCDGMYELNQFEKCKAELHRNTRKYLSAVVNDFNERITVVNENLQDCLGDSLDDFLNKHMKRLSEITEAIKGANFVDSRPLWKIRVDEEKCDVISIEEEKEKLLSPLEVARRERWKRIFVQIYMGRSWVDEVFIRNMFNEKWLPPSFTESTPHLQSLLRPCQETVNKFLRMLHARSPLYNEHTRRIGKQKIYDDCLEQYLNRIQFQTRRTMLTVLRTIRHLRELGNLEGMSKYIESVMGDYVVLKTTRIMPWKFEFINEVYNIYALALTDRYILKANTPVTGAFDQQLSKLLQLPSGLKLRPVVYEFGNKSTYVSVDTFDPRYEKYKKLIGRLEKRLIFTKYSIETCFLLHEIAVAHFNQNRFGECLSIAKKAVEESKNCNSQIWAFICTMLTVKSHVKLHEVEYSQRALTNALDAAIRLKNPKIIDFVELVSSVNENEISMKKSTISTDLIRRKSSKQLSQYTSSERIREKNLLQRSSDPITNILNKLSE